MLLFYLKKKKSIVPTANTKQETIDLLSSDDESSERVATNVDCDATDHISCRNVDPDNAILDKSNVTEQYLPDIVVEAVHPEFYKLGVNSDKSGDVLEAEFLKKVG